MRSFSPKMMCRESMSCAMCCVGNRPQSMCSSEAFRQLCCLPAKNRLMSSWFLTCPHMCSPSRSHVMQWTSCHSLPQNRTFQLWLPGAQARPYASSVMPSNVTLPNFAYACLQALCHKVKEAFQHIKWCLLAMLQSQGPSKLFHVGPATHAKLVHNDVGATWSVLLRHKLQFLSFQPIAGECLMLKKCPTQSWCAHHCRHHRSAKPWERKLHLSTNPHRSASFSFSIWAWIETYGAWWGSWGNESLLDKVLQYV